MFPEIENEGVDATQEHPEESGVQPSPYGERNEELPEQLVNALKATVQAFQQQELYVRRREVLSDRKHRFYERGFQHVYENTRTGTFTLGTPGAAINVEGREIQCPSYIDDYNIYQPYLRVQESILTQNPPGIDFRPDNPNLSEDMEAAETAEGYRKFFDRSNNVKSIQTQIVRMMGLSGRTVLWTRTEANAQKFGLNEDGSPKQMEVATVHGTLESKVPILAKSQEDALYCFLFDDPDIRQAKTEYPDFADKITPNISGLGESAYERTARLGVLQGTRAQAQMGDAFSHLCTRMHCWLRPASFTGEMYNDPLEQPDASDMVEGQQIPTVKEKLQQLFPSGCHAVFVGDVYCGSWDESMDDAIVIGFPYEGDGMFRMCLMGPMLVIQDRFNDNMNAAAEVWDNGWPSTWIHAGDVDYASIEDQKASPYAIRQLKELPNGMKAEDQFYREPNPELPATFMQFVEMLEGPLAQFMLAAPPALFGAAMEDQKTASGYAQARSQAMGQQGLTWASIQAMMARMYYQAALCASTNPDHAEEMVVPGGEDGTSTTIHLSKISKGRFGAFPDEDSSFPESTSAKRTTLASILAMAAQAPNIGGQLFDAPDNWETINTVMGFPELVIPEAESRNKQTFEIEQLLQQSPIPPSPEEIMAGQTAHAAAAIQAHVMGMPEPPPFDPQSLLKPSIPVDPEMDFHEWEFLKCKDWYTSKARRDQEAQGNAAGVQNVKLHALQHQKFMILMAPPPAPVAAPGKPAGGPPHPPGAPKAPPNKAPASPGAPGVPTM